MTRWVYPFGGTETPGSAAMLDLLGGKGANLAEMARMGLPVPPGFTITTEVCTYYYAHEGNFPQTLRIQVEEALQHVGEAAGRQFADPSNPLLVSVRSGARASMPGMMDTVLNLGLNDRTVEGLARQSGNPRFAYDSYRRFIQMYSDVVLDAGHDAFEEIISTFKDENDLALDTDVDAEGWQEIVRRFKEVVRSELGRDFPQDPHEQLWGAIGAVFGSWRNARAETYRRLNNIPESWGTAVNVQAMVFGNMGEDSATGVAFTRNPSTGENALYGEYLVNAQGEDVVAGTRTPYALTKAAREVSKSRELSMEERMPQAFATFSSIVETLERHYRDMQDIEFTIERGRLWMLQTRSGKRTAKAALRIAVDLANEGLINRAEAVQRIDPASLDQLLHPTLDPAAHRKVLTAGLPASPGAASGEVVFDSNEAERLSGEGRAVILVRIETSPEDIHGMHAAKGILTARGGMTSHAAVVARGMGRPCVCGAGALRIDYARKQFSVAGDVIAKGDLITIDGGTGQVIKGRVATVQPELSGDFATLMEWADSFRRMRVRANAETPADAMAAREFGAEGIGLCRTEHMFFDELRIANVREMILADTTKARAAALAKLLPVQRQDFFELFCLMPGMPITIRLLDPPLHEFLPKPEEVEHVAQTMGFDPERLRIRVAELFEFNPMLGHRGCRLGVSFPEIYEMQARAIFEAALMAAEETGRAVVPEVMVPLIALKAELDLIRAGIVSVAEKVQKERGQSLTYQIGTMIELPRAALRAAEIAQAADFFSFGTNDLTQTTFGISRDDSVKFMNDYLQKGLMTQDPFVSLDVSGVGELITIAATRGKASNPALKIGVCGEHGGDPASVHFFEQSGLDYISCSPFRVPIARLAAAQAALAQESKKQ